MKYLHALHVYTCSEYCVFSFAQYRVILALMIVAAGLAAFITWRCHKRRGYRRLQGEDSAEPIQQQQQHMNVDGTMKWTLLSKVIQ